MYTDLDKLLHDGEISVKNVGYVLVLFGGIATFGAVAACATSLHVSVSSAAASSSVSLFATGVGCLLYSRCTEVDAIWKRNRFRTFFFVVACAFVLLWPFLVFTSEGTVALDLYVRWFFAIALFKTFEETARSAVRSSLRRRLETRIGDSVTPFLASDAMNEDVTLTVIRVAPPETAVYAKVGPNGTVENETAEKSPPDVS
jgi:hypothetical protein